jgi:hypothetical protein
VKQAVVAAGSSGIQISPFNNKARDTTQCQITGQTGTGQSAADNEDLCF